MTAAECNLVCRIFRGAYLYVMPPICSVGGLGSILCYFVFTKSKLRTKTSAQFLAAMSVTDCIFLICTFMQWIDKLGLDYSPLNTTVGCKLINFCLTASAISTAWLLIGFSTERVLILRSNNQACRGLVRFYIPLVILGSMLFSLHNFWTMKLHPVVGSQILVIHSQGGPVEEPSSEGTEMAQSIGAAGTLCYSDDVMNPHVPPIIDAVLGFFIPTITIFVENCYIISCIWKGRRGHSRLPRMPDDSANNSSNPEAFRPRLTTKTETAPPVKKFYLCTATGPSSSGTQSMASTSTSHVNNNGTTFNRDCLPVRGGVQIQTLSIRKQYNITMILVLMVASYIVLHIPGYVLRAFPDHFSQNTGNLLRALSQIFEPLFFALNFVICAIPGNTFWQALRQLFSFKNATAAISRRLAIRQRSATTEF